MAIQPTHSSRRILLPVKQWFILFSLAAACFLDMIPLGHAVGVPDWVALVLAFWSVRVPQRVGMGTAFVAGRKRVPSPATGKTAFRIGFVMGVLGQRIERVGR